MAAFDAIETAMVQAFAAKLDPTRQKVLELMDSELQDSKNTRVLDLAARTTQLRADLAKAKKGVNGVVDDDEVRFLQKLLKFFEDQV